ncbi:hypothetical protein [Staphylococcus intermedius]|uniref:Uncharacterized protein n=2 Tax=Staphylococcus intermedius TaxID=1285 RepID=A0A380G9H0_STAIN|nr:hypothetical protein [Staphylococcus intermedius]SUM47789.1 Uncharacterised protein [Staphylococcus intermedius NCTC 11048]
MKEIMYFKRETEVKGIALFLRPAEPMNSEFAHVLEHVLTTRLKNDNFHIINAHATEDYIKITLEHHFDIHRFKPMEYLYALNQQELNRALSEIKQEQSLENKEIKTLMHQIRGEQDTTADQSLAHYNAVLQHTKDTFSFILINNELQSDERYDGFSKNEMRENEKQQLIANSGTLSHNKVEFFYKYVNIPVHTIQKASTIYYIQKLIDFMNKKLASLRSEGIYYSIAFPLYSRNQIELFILISFTQDVKRDFNLEIEKMLSAYDIHHLIDINDGEKVYPYKENLSVIYLSPKFLLNSVPPVTEESIEITQQIIEKMSQ